MGQCEAESLRGISRNLAVNLGGGLCLYIRRPCGREKAAERALFPWSWRSGRCSPPSASKRFAFVPPVFFFVFAVLKVAKCLLLATLDTTKDEKSIILKQQTTYRATYQSYGLSFFTSQWFIELYSHISCIWFYLCWITKLKIYCLYIRSNQICMHLM